MTPSFVRAFLLGTNMAIPTSITDLDVNEALNSPAGSDNVGGTLDNFLRAHAAIIKRQFSKGADINSASTMTIPSDGSFFNVANVVSAINGFSSNFNGRIVYLKFAAGITLNHSTALIMPAGVNVTTQADDVVCFVYESTNVWRCLSYPRYTDAGHPGPDEPATTWPYMTWSDTGNMLLKRRNEANTDWVVEGVLFENMSTGRLLNVQTFTASGTYVPTAGTKTIIVEGVGGGGPGGVFQGNSTGGVTAAGGGAPGAYGRKRMNLGSITSVPITIGAGGTQPSRGGTTSFGAHMSLDGGNVPTAPSLRTSGSISGVHSSTGSSSSGADILIVGQGQAGVALANNSGYGGAGGDSPFGTGGGQATLNDTGVTTGKDGQGYGSGGGGHCNINTGTWGTAGKGAPGILIVYEYA